MSHEPQRVQVELPGYPGVTLTAGTWDDLISAGEQLVRLARQRKGEAAQAASPFAVTGTSADPYRSQDVSRVVQTAVVPRLAHPAGKGGAA